MNQAHDTVTLGAQNKLGDDLAYLASFGEAGFLLVSSSEVKPLSHLAENHRFKDPPPDKSPMTAEGIRRWQDGEEVAAGQLFKRVRRFIERRVIFTHTCIPSVLALWAMGTYCHIFFNYFGYVWLTSLVPSCAKTLVAQIVSLVAFNPTGVLIDPTPATVFRDIDANSSTCAFDEMETLNDEQKGQVRAILNAGFQRGAKVPRMEAVGKQWKLRAFDVYSPKIISGINQVPRTLQTRSFRIEMRKRKKSEHILPFSPDRLEAWSANRRDDMAILALRNAKKIARLYARRDDLVPKQNEDGDVVFDDRLRDIFAPLYVMAKIVDDDLGEPAATSQLYQFLLLQAGARDAEGVGDYVLAVHALWNWAKDRWDQNGNVMIQTHEAQTLFDQAEIDWAATDKAKTKTLLRKLGGTNDSHWWGNRTRRGYWFSKSELQDLVERNPLSSTPIDRKKREER